MTSRADDPRMTAYALDELDPDERREFERALAEDEAARVELRAIARTAIRVEGMLAEPTGLELSQRQRLQLEEVWRAQRDSSRVSDPVLFREFSNPGTRRRDRKRFASSLLSATVLYGAGAAALLVLSTRVALHAVERLQDVQFALPSALDPRAAPHTRMKRVERASPRAAEGSSVGAVIPPAPLGEPAGYRIAYPRSAWMRGIEGEVVVRFVVLEDGSVSDVTIVSGPLELRARVLDAVATWRFRPAHRGSQPLRFIMTEVIRLGLTDG